MKTIVCASWKGGSGKTTLSAACIKSLANKGKKILVIDLDSNLSMTHVFDAVGKSKTSVSFLNGDFSQIYEEHVTDFANLYIIPSELRISRLSNLPERTLKIRIANLLKEQELAGFNEFDYIFIDPPGTMNDLTRAAIAAANQIIIPAMPSEIDFQATGLVMEEMEMMGVEADVQVVLNGFDPKRNINNIAGKFSEQYGEFFYNKPVSAMKSLKNLTANFETYNLQGRAKMIIDDFVEEVVR